MSSYHLLPRLYFNPSFAWEKSFEIFISIKLQTLNKSNKHLKISQLKIEYLEFE
jgi:hypothetical protein